MTTTILTDISAAFSDILKAGHELFNYDYRETATLGDLQAARNDYSEAWADAHINYFRSMFVFLAWRAAKADDPRQDSSDKTARGGRGGGNSALPPTVQARIDLYNSLYSQTVEKLGDYRKIFEDRKILLDASTDPTTYRKMTAQESREFALFLLQNSVMRFPVPSLNGLTLENIGKVEGGAIIEACIERLQEYFIVCGESMAELFGRYGARIQLAKDVEEKYGVIVKKINLVYAKCPQLLTELEINLFELNEPSKKIDLIRLYAKKFVEVLDKSKEYISHQLKQHGAESLVIDGKFIEDENTVPAWSNKAYYLLYIRLALVSKRMTEQLYAIEEAQGLATKVSTQKPEPSLFNDAYSNTMSNTLPNANSVEELLKPLSGVWFNNVKIMSNNDYSKLVEGVKHLVDKNELPRTIHKIQRTEAKNGFIKHIFYVIFNINRRCVDREKCISFLLQTFEQFDTDAASISGTFKTYDGNFRDDIKILAEKTAGV